MREPQIFDYPNDEKQWRKILWHLMPGFALCDRHEWQYQPKPKPGYLVPLMCGYQRISPLYKPGEVANVRDDTVSCAFAEAVYGVGEWCGLHRITDFQMLFWRYHSTDTGYYCKGASTLSENIVNEFDELE